MVGDCIPAYLRIVADAGERGVALMPLAAITWRRVEQRWFTGHLSPDQVRRQIDSIARDIFQGLFQPLELLGAAATWISAADETARVTPLGVWAVGRLAAQLRPKTPVATALPPGVADLGVQRARRNG